MSETHPKIKFSLLKRTNLGCPSIWEYDLDDKHIKLHFRIGRFTHFINNTKIYEIERDQFDISGYMEDEDLYKLLAKYNLLDEQ